MSIITTQPLKDSILASEPQADQTILEKLCDLVRKYQLRWVPAAEDKGGAGAYFIMADVAKAKGLDAEDYRKHWSDDSESTAAVKGRQSESLAGKDFKLVGESLKSFKNIYFDLYGKSLGRAPSLLIGDWKRTYSYLCQGHSEAAQNFQSLGSDAVEEATKADIQKQSNVVKLFTEEDIQLQLIKLTAYSTVNFRFEVGVLNSFDTPDQASHRRWDWVERLPKVTKIYELKCRTISELDVRTTLFDKHYLQLAAEKYPNKPIEFVFTSPKGITWEAKNLIAELMKGQYSYTDILGVKAKITFIDLQEVAHRLVNNIISNNPQEAWFWLLNQIRTTDLKEVVSKKTTHQLNAQISELYEQGILVRKTANNVIQFPANRSVA